MENMEEGNANGQSSKPAKNGIATEAAYNDVPDSLTVRKLQRRVSFQRIALMLLGLIAAVLLALTIWLAVIRHDYASKDRLNYALNGVVLSADPRTNVDNYIYGGSMFAGSGFWAQRITMPEARSDFAALPVGGYIYIIGGADSDGNVMDTVLRYDPLLHEYQPMASLLTPRWRFGATELNGLIYIVGGYVGTSDALQDASVEVYDIANNRSSAGPSLNVQRGDNCAATANGKVYTFGGYGYEYADTLNSTEQLDPATGKWSLVAEMPTPRGDVVCLGLSSTNKIYVVGGFYDPTNQFSPSSFLNTMDIYDPVQDNWSPGANMSAVRGDAGLATTPSGDLMVAGGETHDGEQYTQIPQHSVEVYYPKWDVWVPKAPLGTARFRHALASAYDSIYAFGGQEVCPTGNCSATALSTVENFLDAFHTEVFINVRASDAVV
eukprot:jgi/Chlat1/8369/Chrsp80S07799